MQRLTLPLSRDSDGQALDQQPGDGSTVEAGRPSTARQPNKRRRHRLSPLVADAKRLSLLLGGVGIRSIRSWDAGGKLPKPIRLGSRVVWSIREIRDWLHAGAPDRATWERLKTRNR